MAMLILVGLPVFYFRGYLLLPAIGEFLRWLEAKLKSQLAIAISGIRTAA